MKIAFFGSSHFSQEILQGLLDRNIIPDLIITNPDKRCGRGYHLKPMPLKTFAFSRGLTVETPLDVNDPSFIEILRKKKTDLFVIASFGQILSRELLSSAAVMPVAVHPSLLPRYRGAAPINWVLINGETITGTTIFKVNEKVDAGGIIAQNVMSIACSDDALTLSSKLAQLSVPLLADSIYSIEQGAVRVCPQNTDFVSYAPRLSKQDGHIMWTQTAYQIYNLVRGVRGWPHAYTKYKGRLLKISEVAVIQESSQALPGTVITVTKNEIHVACGEGVIVIKRLIPQGKREMDTASFLCGHKVTVGELFQ